MGITQRQRRGERTRDWRGGGVRQGDGRRPSRLERRWQVESVRQKQALQCSVRRGADEAILRGGKRRGRSGGAARNSRDQYH